MVVLTFVVLKTQKLSGLEVGRGGGEYSVFQGQDD